MKAMKNKVYLEGYLYDHGLQKKVTGPNSKNPGTEYINGKISVATDEACTNIIDVYYTYVVSTTSKGTPNATYKTLSDIIDGVHKTYMSDGKDKALKVRVDTSIALNEWYDKDDQLISVKRNEGGFIHIVTALNEDEKARNYFEEDIIITGARNIEADEDRNLPEKLILRGAIFNFRNEILPVEFSVINPNAISYFESLELSKSNVVFTKIKGRQISETVTRTIVEEGAFGDSVREVTNTRKDSVVTWAMGEPYEFDSEDTILASEFAKLIQDRETALATLKQRNDEYRESKAATPSAPVANTGGFDF